MAARAISLRFLTTLLLRDSKLRGECAPQIKRIFERHQPCPTTSQLTPPLSPTTRHKTWSPALPRSPSPSVTAPRLHRYFSLHARRIKVQNSKTKHGLEFKNRQHARLPHNGGLGSLQRNATTPCRSPVGAYTRKCMASFSAPHSCYAFRSRAKSISAGEPNAEWASLHQRISHRFDRNTRSSGPHSRSASLSRTSAWRYTPTPR